MRALFTKRDTTTELFELNESIREVVALSMAELRSRGIALRLEFADDLPPVDGDRIQLQQVMLNLVKNAVDSMSAVEHGPQQLLISTAKVESDVLVAVKDSGPGVDPAHVARISDAFYSTKPGGLGIGLSICRTIIEARASRIGGPVCQVGLNSPPGHSCGRSGDSCLARRMRRATGFSGRSLSPPEAPHSPPRAGRYR